MPSNTTIPDSANTTYLIDASIYIFRAWFGIPDHFFDDSGRPMNAVYGYIAFLLRFLQQAKPEKVVAAFDESLETGFRHQIYPDYKANRALPDPDLAYQLASCKAITEMLGITTLASPVYEADDLIASVARKRRQRGDRVVVLSTDKDLAQMITREDYLWDFHKQALWSYDALNQAWGFPVERVANYLALVGDTIDNIPGVPGLGAKSGQKLCAYYESIDHLYDDLNSMDTLGIRGALKLKQCLLDEEDSVRLYHQLTQLRDNAKCSWGNKAVKLKSPDIKALQTWHKTSGLQRALKLENYFKTVE